MKREDLGLAVLLALAAIPFDPRWIDFELARRGIVLLLAAWLSWRASLTWCTRLPSGSLWLGALCIWSFVRCLGVSNPMEGLLRAAYLGAIWIVFVHGASLPTERIARAAIPVTLVAAGYGLLQASGLLVEWTGSEWPRGYARTQPVSTLGNLNVASEFVAICAAALCARVASQPRALLALATACVAGWYLGVNGSRSGLLALGIAGVGLAAVAAGPWTVRARLLAPAALAALAWLSSSSTAADPAAAPDAWLPTRPSTIEVRTEIWRACADMIADAPVAGHGAGQFRYEYPRYRTEREIELSSFGRRFVTFTATAHNDHLELAVDGGMPAAILWVGFWAAVLFAGLRDRARWPLLAPAGAFVVLATVRSPLANGPAALLVFAWLGAACARSSEPGRPGLPTRSLLFLGGFAGAFVGAAVVASQTLAARFVATPSAERSAHRDVLDAAIALHPSESRLRSLRIGEIRRAAPDARTAWREGRPDVDQLLACDPNNPQALFLIADFAHAAGEHDAAGLALAGVLRLDPHEPRAVLLAATRAALASDARAALALLYREPHPRLREGLADHLSDLAALITDPRASGLLVGEARFVRAVDSLLANPLSTERIDASRMPARVDAHRNRALYARQLLARGERDAADALAPDRLDMNSEVRALLAPILEALAELPRWRAAVGA